jgi:hypothetical protein
MKTNQWFLMGALALAGCASSLNVQTDYDRQANFRQYGTFAVQADPKYNHDPVLGSELNLRRISQALQAQMQAKGYQPSNSPDLLVSVETDTRDRQDVQSYNNFTPYWWYFYGPRQNTYTRNYEEDRIIVNVRDARANRMVWQGFTSGQILTSRTKDPERVLNNAVAQVMKAFPARGDGGGQTSDR